jgi:hypothetical protein
MKKLFVLFTMIIFTISSFGQDFSFNKASKLLKEEFPKIYSVISNEAISHYQSSDLQIAEINSQSFCCAAYILLIITPGNPIIPKDELTLIQAKSVENNCKNFTNNKECETLKDPNAKLDCALSYMIIDWVKVILEISDKMESYKLTHREI